MRKPRIAVILDENTSGDATRYEAAKGYFRGVRDAGGLPFGIPYLPEMVEVVLGEFAGLPQRLPSDARPAGDDAASPGARPAWPIPCRRACRQLTSGSDHRRANH